MRIFTAVRHSNDPGRYYGGLWSGNFYPALRTLGHEIVESQVDLLPLSRFMQIGGAFTGEELAVRGETTASILKEVEAAHRQRPIDLFLSYFYNAHFAPEGFARLRELGIPSVNFYCNSVYQFDLVKDIARHADFSWHPERDARSAYLNIGARPVWVQMGADPSVYRPLPNVVRQSTACFIGQRYADRDRWIAELIKADLPVEVYGPGWKDEEPTDVESSNESSEYLGRIHPVPGTVASYGAMIRAAVASVGLMPAAARMVRQFQYGRKTAQLSALIKPHAHGRISFERIAEIFAGHAVCLNFSNVWADGQPGSSLVAHVRLRDFEAPMCRTCYLTGHSQEIEEFYVLGTEIDTYHTSEELVAKTRFYLSHPESAERLRHSGFERARRDHTWENRFRALFRAIGL